MKFNGLTIKLEALTYRQLQQVAKKIRQIAKITIRANQKRGDLIQDLFELGSFGYLIHAAIRLVVEP